MSISTQTAEDVADAEDQSCPSTFAQGTPSFVEG